MATLPGLPSAAGQFLLLAPPRNSPSGWQVRLHHCLGLFTRTDLAGRKRCQQDPGGKDGFDQVVLQPNLG